MSDAFTPEQQRAFFDEVWANHNPYGDASSATCPNDGYQMKAFVYRTEQLKADLSVSCPRCGFQSLKSELDPRAVTFRPWTDDEKQAMVDLALQRGQLHCPVDGTRLPAKPFGPEVLLHCFRCGNNYCGSIHHRIGTGKPIELSAPVRFAHTERATTPMKWDLFISHAHEDKKEVADPLASRFGELGLDVWYDKAILKVGDSLRRKIDEGLANSTFGLVVLSPHFFKKHWPQKELDGLVALESGRDKKILPVWHNVTQVDVAQFSPTLADKMGVRTSEGLDFVVEEIMSVVRPTQKVESKSLPISNSLPADAVKILREAASTPTGRILSEDLTSDGYRLMAGEFVFEEANGGSRRDVVRYKGIINRLHEAGLIEEITDGLYELTESGYQVADNSEGRED